MKKIILAAANPYNEKYFFDDQYELPSAIKDEIRILCTLMANRLQCVFALAIQEGEVVFETQVGDNAFYFDEINARLEIKKLCKDHAELIESLQLWAQVKLVDKL